MITGIPGSFLPPQGNRLRNARGLAVVGALAAAAFAIAVAPLSWLLIGLAALAAALLALILPWLAWLALAFLLPVSSALRIGPASLTDLLLAVALALWFVSIASKKRAVTAARLPLWALAPYLFILYLSSLGARNLDEALTEMVKWIEFGALLWVVPLALPPRAVPWLVVALLAAAAIQGIYGLYQFLFRIGPDWFLIQGRFMRASGVFGQPNPYGAYLGLSLPVAVSLTLWSFAQMVQRRSAIAMLWFLLSLAATLCIGVGLATSWSRGAWLGAAGGLMVVLAFFNRHSRLLLGSGLSALLATAFVGALNPAWIPVAISSRIGDIPAYLGFVDILSLEVNDDNFAVIERVAHWVAAIRMWEASPWLGVGPGNYAAAYGAVALPRWSDPLGHAHNIYLNVLGETGLLGFSAFLLMWAVLVGWLLGQIRGALAAESWARALAVGVLGVTTHLAIHSFFDNLFVQGMYLHVAFWLAVVAANSRLANAPAYRLRNSPFSESDG